MRFSGFRWNLDIEDNTLAQLGPMGDDVHMLRGAGPSPDLRPYIVLDFEPEPGEAATGRSIFLSQLGDVANADLALLLKNGGVDFAATFTIRPEHAFTLNPLTGEVTPRIPTASDIAAAGGRVENILVRAVATRASDDSVVVLQIRFHFHDELDTSHLTLSPKTLTIRVATGNQRTNRFGVLAQFDDGVVGEVSHLPGLTWTLLQKDSTGALVPVALNPTTNQFELSEGGTVVLSMTPEGLLFAVEEFSSDVFVQCGISMRTGDLFQTPPAQVLSGGPWVDANPLKVRFIDGDGLNRLDEVSNVLILPDGFRAADEQIFDELARRLVAGIRNTPSADPYRRFLTNRSINFFSSFIPSQDFGCSVSHELAPAVAGALYNTLPDSIRPKVTASAIEHLVYIVGLPIPADENLTLNDAITRWTKMFGDAFTTTVPLSVLQPGPTPKDIGLFAQWKNLAGRTLAVEHDTALGINIGARPNASTGGLLGHIGFNRFRATVADLRQHLSTVAIVSDSFGTQIPALWKTPQQGDAGANGKDERLVIILAAGVPQMGTTPLQNHLSIIGLGFAIRPILVRDFVPPPSSPPDGWRIVDVDPGPPNAEPFVPTQGVVLHELSHSISCGDEYGGDDDPPAAGTVFLIQDFGNLVLDASVRGPNPGPGQPIDMTQSMWGAVPRIRAAGVLTKTPEAIGGQYRITLRLHQADPFKNLALKPGDLLFLRARPLLRAIFALTHPDPENPLPIPPDFSIGLSPPLAFQGFDSSGGSDDALLVNVVGGGTLGGAWNVPGPVRFHNPVLFVPRIGADGKPQTILSPAVAAHIKAVNAPTTRRPGVACTPSDNFATNPSEEDLVEKPEPIASMPASVVNAVGMRFLPRVVGLYDRGAGIDCGVYHPTGYCAMRRSSKVYIQRPTPFVRNFRVGSTTEFCYVCRYLLIDSIDPTLHGEFDDQYSKLYVESTP
jgi:hypothetical protein